MAEFVFTITQGRTGTASIARFFGEKDPGALAVHELLTPEAHGVFTPDIGIMRRFNTFGLTGEIEAFWKRKLKIVSQELAKRGKKRFVETSHMNAKSGLVEYALKHLVGDSDFRVRFLIVDRALEEIARSLYERRDMSKMENMWLWYLDPEYKQNLVDRKPFGERSYRGLLAWYVCEMEARKAKYESLLRDKFNLTRVDIGDPGWTRTLSLSYGVEWKEGDRPFIENKGVAEPKRVELERTFRKLFAKLTSPRTQH